MLKKKKKKLHLKLIQRNGYGCDSCEACRKWRRWSILSSINILHDLWFWLNILSYTVWFFFFFFFEKQTSKFQKINIGIWNIQNFPEFLHTIFGVWQFHYWFSHLLQHQTLLLILIQELQSPNWSYRGYFSCFYLDILFLE